MPILFKGNFKGEMPKVSAKLLPENYARVAINCDLQDGRIRALRAPKEVMDLGTDTFYTIYNMYPGCIGDVWLAWGLFIDVVELQIPGEYRIAFSDRTTYPKQTLCEWAGSNGDPPDTTRRLGVVEPTTVLVPEKVGADTGDILDSVSYVYTLVTAWGEESAPSLPSDTYDVYEGQHIKINNFVKNSLASTGNEITHFRLYRIVRASDGSAEYQLVKVRPGGLTATPVYDIPVDDVASSSVYVYDIDDSGAVNSLSTDLDEVLMTEGWAPAPDDIRGLCQFQNSVLVGWKSNTVYLSSIEAHYAFPDDGDHRYAVGSRIKAGGIYNEDYIVATDRHPYVLSGMDPASMQKIKFDINQPCLNSRGYVITHFGAMWPCPDGLFLFDGTPPGRLVTEDLYTREQWQAIGPDDMIGFYYNRKYYGFLEGTGNGFIIDFSLTEPYVVEIQLTKSVYGGYVDAHDDILNLILHDDTNFYIEEWESSAERLTCKWHSGIRQTIPSNFPWAQLVGDFTGGNVIFKLYDGDVLIYSVEISSMEPFRLPDDFLGREWSVYVETSGAAIDFFSLGKDIHDLGFEV